MSRYKISRLALALFITLFLAGCAVSIDSSERIHSTSWDSRMVSMIEPGHTSTDELQRLLGEPSRKTDTADGAQIWQFENRYSKDNRVSVIFLLHAHTSRDKISQLNVELREGRVSDYWITEH